MMGSLNSLLWNTNWAKTTLPTVAADFLMTTLTSDNTYNLGNGKGFKSNNGVLNDFKSGKYSVPGGNWQQDALDYFGFEGTYVKGRFDNDAWFDYKTGIGYSDGAFTSYDNLKQCYFKESFEKRTFLMGRTAKADEPTGWFADDIWAQELQGHIYQYKHSGFYSQADPKAEKYISSVIKEINNINIKYGYEVYKNINYKKKWWHFIYKIPRRW